MSLEIYGFILLGGLFAAICLGFPISFTLITIGMIFGYIAMGPKVFYLMSLSWYDTMVDTILASVALFTFMGYVLEKAGLMERLFHALLLISGRLKGSLYLGTIFSATLFAAATGIVGAAVMIIGLMAAPVMKKTGYSPGLSAGAITAGGTLGILIPPSIMLVVMGPVMQVSVARLFAAAIFPGIMLATLYTLYCMIRVWINPTLGPSLPDEELDVTTGFKVREFFFGLVPPSVLILATLGTIITGIATPTEGAALGCLGALIVALMNKRLTFALLKEAVFRTAETTSMVMILLAASTFMGVVFSALGTPTFIAKLLLSWDLPNWVFLFGILLTCFILGWPLEWIPIVVIIIPIFLPVVMEMVALSAYYIKGIMPEWELLDIYKGMMPFMGLQIFGVTMVYLFPPLALWLPKVLFG